MIPFLIGAGVGAPAALAGLLAWGILSGPPRPDVPYTREDLCGEDL
jgi:hypothetical protein